MLGILNINGLGKKKWEKRQFHLKQNEDTWPLQQLCQQNEKDDNINTRNPTEKEHHMEFCTFRGAGVCLIIFAREEDIHTHGHPETYKHTHTNRKLIKQAKIHRQRVQNRQAESWSWTVRQAAAQAGELQWCKWPRRFIPRLPLPPSVRPFLLLSSSFMSSFSHNPFASALCQHLSSALASD